MKQTCLVTGQLVIWFFDDGLTRESPVERCTSLVVSQMRLPESQSPKRPFPIVCWLGRGHIQSLALPFLHSGITPWQCRLHCQCAQGPLVHQGPRRQHRASSPTMPAACPDPPRPPAASSRSAGHPASRTCRVARGFAFRASGLNCPRVLARQAAQQKHKQAIQSLALRCSCPSTALDFFLALPCFPTSTCSSLHIRIINRASPCASQAVLGPVSSSAATTAAAEIASLNFVSCLAGRS